MTNTGNPESAAAKRRGWGAIALALVLVAIAALVGVQILGVLYGVLFPPAPPTLEGYEITTHTNSSYGVDDWLYASPDDACRVVRFYQSAGAQCTIAPQVCDAGLFTTEAPRAGVNVARCVGEIEWSIFAQRYHVNIAGGYDPSMPTRVRLEREIYWTGSLPAARD